MQIVERQQGPAGASRVRNEAQYRGRRYCWVHTLPRRFGPHAIRRGELRQNVDQRCASLKITPQENGRATLERMSQGVRNWVQ